jgi:5'-deoxynucleotidase YfbR-like HD superfamily hydrolase
MFDARLRMLAFVERWNVAPRLHRQSVAEHSYFVALYAFEITVALGRHAILGDILPLALCHDLGEIVTGDMPGPAKRAIVDPVRLKEYEDDFLSEVGMDYEPGEMDKAIIKAADTIEAWFWLAMEVARGNQLMRDELYTAMGRARKACKALDVYSRAGFKSGLDIYHVVEAEADRLNYSMPLAPRLDTDLPEEEPVEEIPF